MNLRNLNLYLGLLFLLMIHVLPFRFQISMDDAVLPGADGKIVAWVEED